MALRRAQLRAVKASKMATGTSRIVGMLNLHSTMNPCIAGIQPLIDRAAAELEAIGAKPQTVGGPTGSLTPSAWEPKECVSRSHLREAISRSYQIGVGSHQMDGASASQDATRTNQVPHWDALCQCACNLMSTPARSSPESGRAKTRTLPPRFSLSARSVPEGRRAEDFARASSVTHARARASVGGSIPRTPWLARSLRLASESD